MFSAETVLNRNRYEDGQEYLWIDDDTRSRGHWIGVRAGRILRVFPPNGENNRWDVVSRNGHTKSFTESEGDAEKKAFSVANFLLGIQ